LQSEDNQKLAMPAHSTPTSQVARFCDWTKRRNWPTLAAVGALKFIIGIWLPFGLFFETLTTTTLGLGELQQLFAENIFRRTRKSYCFKISMRNAKIQNNVM